MKKKPFSEIPYLQSDKLVLKQLTDKDADALLELAQSKSVYRYLPTFLFEKQYEDMHYVIDHMYTDNFESSIILGIFNKEDTFYGLAEMYGFRDPIHKISVGYRLLESAWGKGIATESLRLMIEYLIEECDIEIITASVMIENQISNGVLEYNGFTLVDSAVEEDWGYDHPVLADKWIR